MREVLDLKVWSTNRGKHYGGLRVKVRKNGDRSKVLKMFSSKGIAGFVEIG